jgi:ferredoxin
MVHVRVDQEKCVSAGRCVADEPAAFGFDADELATLLPGATELSAERMIVIARRCPGLAIEVVDDGGVVLAP